MITGMKPASEMTWMLEALSIDVAFDGVSPSGNIVCAVYFETIRIKIWIRWFRGSSGMMFTGYISVFGGSKWNSIVIWWCECWGSYGIGGSEVRYLFCSCLFETINIEW